MGDIFHLMVSYKTSTSYEEEKFNPKDLPEVQNS